jgi:spermidine synthase
MHSAADLFGTFAGQAPDFAEWLKDAQINRDRNLRLEYLAGRGLNLYRADAIYSEMATHGREPNGIFTGSAAIQSETLQRIRNAQVK